MFVMQEGFTINDSYYDQAEYTNGASDHKPLYAEVTLLTGGENCNGREEFTGVKCKTRGGAVKKTIVKARNGTPSQPYMCELATGQTDTRDAKDNGRIKFKFRGAKRPPCGENAASFCKTGVDFACGC